jgi:hypothetical protein
VVPLDTRDVDQQLTQLQHHRDGAALQDVFGERDQPLRDLAHLLHHLLDARQELLLVEFYYQEALIAGGPPNYSQNIAYVENVAGE